MSEHRPATWGSGKKTVQARYERPVTPPMQIDTPPQEPDGPQATDAARALADELHVDLATVEGTGKDGNITIRDVQAAHDSANGPADEPADSATT